MAANLPNFLPNPALLAAPAGLAPPNHTSHLHAPNPFVRPVAIQVAVVLFGAIVITCMRLFTQHFVSDGLVAEDYIMLVALVIQTANVIFDIFIVHSGIGKHMWNISMEDFIRASMLAWVFATLFHITVALVKVAIVLQIKRIFGTNKRIRTICWLCIAVDTMFYVLCVLLNIFQCTPISGAWNRGQPSKCISVAALYKASGIFNVISDAVMISIPIIIIMRLKMSVRNKWLVVAVFATGIVAWIATFLRVVWTFRTFRYHDISFGIVWVGLAGTYEVCFGILTFFMPMGGVFVKYIRNKLFGPPKSLPSSPLQRQYARPVAEKVWPKHPYEMPSLASFEQRTLEIERQVTTTIEYTTTHSEIEKGSYTESGGTDSLEGGRW